MNATRNPQRAAMRMWLVVVVLGCCLAAAPLVFSVGLHSGGGTMAMAGLSIALLSLIVAMIHRKRARLFGRMMAGEDVLAITYLYTPRRSTSRVVVRIPIPAGARKKAEDICAFFSKKNEE